VLLFALLKFWGDEKSDIKVPFALWAASIAYTWWATLQMRRDLAPIQESAASLLQFLA
jgi:hypothetical protein